MLADAVDASRDRGQRVDARSASRCRTGARVEPTRDALRDDPVGRLAVVLDRPGLGALRRRRTRAQAGPGGLPPHAALQADRHRRHGRARAPTDDLAGHREVRALHGAWWSRPTWWSLSDRRCSWSPGRPGPSPFTAATETVERLGRAEPRDRRAARGGRDGRRLAVGAGDLVRRDRPSRRSAGVAQDTVALRDGSSVLGDRSGRRGRRLRRSTGGRRRSTSRTRRSPRLPSTLKDTRTVCPASEERSSSLEP